jgi:hypothetical protein
VGVLGALGKQQRLLLDDNHLLFDNLMAGALALNPKSTRFLNINDCQIHPGLSKAIEVATDRPVKGKCITVGYQVQLPVCAAAVTDKADTSSESFIFHPILFLSIYHLNHWYISELIL